MRRVRATLMPSLAIDRRAPRPIYRQIYEGLRSAIIEGRLRPGQGVPSTRTLASELQISRIPVVNAYEQLRTEGYLEAAVGAGTRVAESIVDEASRSSTLTRPRRANRRPVEHTPRTMSRRSEELGRAATSQPWLPRQGPFRMNLPALEQFPSSVWGKLVSRHARVMTRAIMAYGDASV